MRMTDGERSALRMLIAAGIQTIVDIGRAIRGAEDASQTDPTRDQACRNADVLVSAIQAYSNAADKTSESRR